MAASLRPSGVGSAGGARRACHAAISESNSKTMAAGPSTPCSRSCVLMMRFCAPLTFRAWVCALIMASPSSSSTMDGGTSTPSVLATLTSAVVCATSTPRACQPYRRLPVRLQPAPRQSVSLRNVTAPSCAPLAGGVQYPKHHDLTVCGDH